MRKDSIDEFFSEWSIHQDDFPPLTAEMQFIYRIARASKIFGERLDSTCARHGLTRSQFEAMAVLRRRHPMPLSAGDLMKASLLTSGSITAMLNQLQKKGLIEKRIHPEDKRRIEVMLTRKGIEKIEKAICERIEDNRRMANLLQPGEKKEINRSMKSFLLSLEADRG